MAKAKIKKRNAPSHPPLKIRGGKGSYEKRKAADVSTTPQITTVAQGPLATAFQTYTFRKVDGNFYETLREGVPIIDAAIRRLISLNGTIKVIGDNSDLVKELEDFCLNVPVNDMQKGIHAYLENASNETFEQGFSISEFISTKDRKDIAGLRVADSKRIIFRRNNAGVAEPWYRTGEPLASNYAMPATIIQQLLTTRYGQSVSYNGVDEVKLSMDNKVYFSINNENSDPYGVSIMRSLEFVSQILVTIQNNIKNTSERFGDPMYHVHLETTSKGEIEAQRKKVETDFNTVVTAKRQGKSGDLVTAGGPNSKVTVTVIGHDGQIIEYDVSLRHLLEQIVSKTNLPAWLLGIYWSTTERMATLEIEAALADAKIRQFAMLPEFLRLFSAFLRLRGRTWKRVTTSLDKPGDWGIIFETPNLRDVLAIAQARFLNAQADMMGTPAASPTGKSSKRIVHREKGKCACGKSHQSSSISLQHAKELQRPTPWPELDKVEGEYETTLKTRWAELQEKVMMILKLDSANVGVRSHHPQKDGGTPSLLPGLEAFQFTTEQRAMVMDAYKKWMGSFNIDDADSAIKWYYGQAYSLGLIQAAKLISKDRPILDIIKNQEVYDELCQNGFQLVKENATKAMVEKILPEMEAQMLVGTNPISVAERLKKLFGDANSDWERVARTEMSSAAEQAKLDEWAEWKVNKVEFTPAPDACAFCFSLAGDYDVGECPIPGTGTHPRCRCSIRPAASETQ